MSLTNYGGNLAAAALVGSGPFYISLHTGSPGADGSAAELAGDGYARQASAFTVTGKVGANDAALTYGPATADHGTVTHAAIWDAASGGNCLATDALTVSRAWPNGATFTIAIGDATLTLS